MKVLAHIPGPWKAHLASAHWNVRAGQETIANVFRHIGSPVTMEQDGEGDANAHLIAAAPALLAALQALMTLDELEMGDDSLLPPEHPKAMAQAALTLARGGAQ